MRNFFYFLEELLSRLVILALWLYGKWVFRILNRVKIEGRENLPYRDENNGKKSLGALCRKIGFLIVSNHLTLLDSLLIGISVVSFREILFYGEVIPWHTPDGKNFFSNPLIAFIMRLLRCIRTNRRPKTEAEREEAYDNYRQALSRGNLEIFLEGTRSKNGEIGNHTNAVAETVYRFYPPVIPIYIEKNVQKIMPLSMGSKIGLNFFFLRRGHRSLIRIGKTMEFDETEFGKYDPNKRKEVCEKFGQRIREEIIKLSKTP